MKDHPDERNAGDDRYRPRHLTLRDPHHDAQLLRDLALINTRTIAELGPLPPGGLPVEPKRKPEPLRPRAQVIQNTEEGQMKPIDVAAITVFGVAATFAAGCRPAALQQQANDSPTAQTESVAKKNPDIEDNPSTNTRHELGKGAANLCAEEETLVHCTTEENKELLLCKRGENLLYSFGPVGGAPELSIVVPKNDISNYRRELIEGAPSYTVAFMHKNLMYTIFSRVKPASGQSEYMTGVDVSRGSTNVDFILCDQPTSESHK